MMKIVLMHFGYIFPDLLQTPVAFPIFSPLFDFFTRPHLFLSLPSNFNSHFLFVPALNHGLLLDDLGGLLPKLRWESDKVK